MLKFLPLGKDFDKIKEYLALCDGEICDLTLGVRFMWRDEFKIDYAIYNHTLIMYQKSKDGTNGFYYPIGKDHEGAILEIEKYSRAKFLPLSYCCLTNEQAEFLKNRYFDCESTISRDWCDYIYDAENFKSYSGKKFSGQRNHYNKFKKLYPDYIYKNIEESDYEGIKTFLYEYEKSRTYDSWSERVEKDKVFELIENMERFNQVGGLIKVGEKVIAISVGEIVGQTLVVHTEKALKEYAGVYPTMAHEFAKANAKEKVKFINREEDCGITGLRISKTQYHPIKLQEKVFLSVKTLISKIQPFSQIKADCLIIRELQLKEAESYKNLYLDDNLNKWWGYDYREDLANQTPSAEYFFNFQNLLKKKGEEFSFAVLNDDELVGELVLHNFDYFGGLEIGFRFFKEHQGKGYATISASALIEYAKKVLGAKTIKSRCYKENLPSRKLIERLGLKLTHENDTHYFFSQDLNN